MSDKFYTLPKLSFAYDALSPILSQEQVETHYKKHHDAYVKKTNELLNKIDDFRRDGDEIEVNNVASKLSFNIGGVTLHNLFWENLVPPSQFLMPDGEIKDSINSNFGSIERFISEFTECATTIEGSGWSLLTYDVGTGRLMIFPIGNHNLKLVPMQKILLVLDMWEHAYYIDYKNDKKSYVSNFWKILNWNVVNTRLSK